MESLLKVKPCRFRGGERFPVVTTEAGMPQYYPNRFLVDLRSEKNQSNTLRSAANAIVFLRRIELILGIDVVNRMTSGNFLKDFELDRLKDAMRRTADHLKEQLESKKSAPGAKVVSLASYRRRHKGAVGTPETFVTRGSYGARATYIAGYLKCLGTVAVDAARDATERVYLTQQLEKVTRSIYVSIPEGYATASAQYQRLGLSYEMEAVLRTVIEPEHPQNPWSLRTRVRNRMIIKILLGIGIRRGELLNLRIDDIDLKANKVFIRRLPDNPDDPRLHEPNVKTLARILTITDSLAEVIHHYIVNVRRHYQKARRHDFLVVSSTDGSPLSLSGLTRVFTAVCENVPGIPSDFGAHICRHTWNDRYSDFCDAKEVDEETERRTRCKIMGWTPGSHMAEVYTKRSSRDEVDKMMLGQQQYVSKGRLGALLEECKFTGEYAKDRSHGAEKAHKPTASK